MPVMGKFPNRVNREYVSEVPAYRYLLPCGHKVKYHWRVNCREWVWCTFCGKPFYRRGNKVTEALPRTAVLPGEANAVAAADEVVEPAKRRRDRILSDDQISLMIDNAILRNRIASLIEGTDFSRGTWEKCKIAAEVLNDDALDAVKGLRTQLGRVGRPHGPLAPEPIKPDMVKGIVLQMPGMRKHADVREETPTGEKRYNKPVKAKTGCSIKRCTGKPFTGGRCKHHFKEYLEAHGKTWNPEWDGKA